LFPDPDTGGLLDPDGISHRFREAVERARVRALRFHDLRHTFCSRQAQAGVHVTKIQEWAGHASLQTTEGYMHLAPKPEDADQLSRSNALKPVLSADAGDDADPVEELRRQLAELTETLARLAQDRKHSASIDPLETT
jgi:hypothetical protein